MSSQTLSLDIVSHGVRTEKRPSRKSIEIDTLGSWLFILVFLSSHYWILFIIILGGDVLQEHGGGHERVVYKGRLSNHCGVSH